MDNVVRILDLRLIYYIDHDGKKNVGANLPHADRVMLDYAVKHHKKEIPQNHGFDRRENMKRFDQSRRNGMRMIPPREMNGRNGVQFRNKAPKRMTEMPMTSNIVVKK